MNLKNLFGNNKKETPVEYFLAVEIHESLIKSVCWELLDGEPRVIGQGSYEMWEDEESLINGVDASITEAIKGLKTQPHRVILGLPESWLGDAGIHPTKKALIGKIVGELKLTPIGVVPTTQAIAHYLKQTEGIPPTAILLEIYQSKIVVSVIKLGKVEATEEVGASGDIARDIEEGLARMEFDSLPARFLLTDGSNLEDEQQQVLAYPWQERLPFVHMPKVEILPVDLSIKAVALAGGIEAAEHLGLEVKEAETADEKILDVNPPEANVYVPDKPLEELEKLGFSFEEALPPAEIPTKETAVPQSVSIPAEELATPQINEMPAIDADKAQFALDQNKKSPVSRRLNLIRLVPRFSLSLPRLALPSKKLSLALATVCLLVFIALPVIYFFFGSAEIKVYVTPQKLNRELEIAIAEASQADLPTLIASKQTVSGSAKEEIATTGEAIVGEKATGNITIFNRTSAPITLKSGSVITADTGKSSFHIDVEVVIASKSADLLSGKEEFGKKDGIAVKSTKIGAEHNLAKMTTFAIENYSKSIIYAVAETDFSGGTSRTVRAVDKKDQEKVLGAATSKIKEQTSAALQSQDPDKGYLPLNDLHFDQKKFSQGIGEEAADLSLELSGSVDLLVYSLADLFNLIKDKFQSEIPAGLSFTPDSTQINIDNPTQKGEIYIAKALVDATLFQQINQEEYSKMLQGKTIAKGRQLLQSISGFSEAKAITSPPIPFLSSTFLPRRISLEVIPK